MKVLQRFSKFLLVSSLLAVVAVGFGLGRSEAAVAVDVPDYRIQLSPARVDLDLVPGKSDTGVFEVQNTGKKEFDFAISVAPYSVVDENYSPDYDTEGVYNDIVDWVTFSRTEGTVEPNGAVEIRFTVKVPADVPAGGQYAVILAQITNEEEENVSGASMHVSKRVGIVIYSEVDGVTRKTGEIIDNKISGILFNPPVIATSTVSNTGNTHATARYVMQVYPLFGDEEIYTNEETPETRVILPETRRYNSISWDGAPHLGIFRVKQTVYIFGEMSVTERIVVLCPIWFLFVILLLIFLGIFWVFTRVKARRDGRA